MNRIAYLLLGLLAIGPAQAQTPTTPAIAAMVCANNTVVPTPVSGQFFYVQCDSTGKLLTNAAGSTPGGSNTQVQFNDSGAFGGSSLFTFSKTTGNINVNNYYANSLVTTSAGTTTILTAASARNNALTGSSSQTYQLPDATTLFLGPAFVFNNNSSGSLVITNAGGSTLYTVPAGGLVTAGPTNIGTANGSWDIHPVPPSTVTWGSGTTGLVFNTALSTSPSITAGTPSGTSPVFIPRRDALTTGIGAQAAGNLSLVAAGTETVRVTSTGAKIGAGSEITSSGAGGALVASAYTDTTDAANISTGTIPTARLGGAWTAYTPSISCASGTITTLGTTTGRWQQLGKTVAVEMDITITTNGSCAGYISPTLPTTTNSAAAFAGRENTNGKMLSVSFASGVNQGVVVNYDNTYPGSSGARIILTGVYETQ